MTSCSREREKELCGEPSKELLGEKSHLREDHEAFGEPCTSSLGLQTEASSTAETRLVEVDMTDTASEASSLFDLR